MNKIYALPEDELRGGLYRRIFLLMGKNPGTWQTAGAVAGLFGGLLSVALGVLAWVVVRFTAPVGGLGSFLNGAEIAFFVLPLPLLALGAHCLDLLEKKRQPSPSPLSYSPTPAPSEMRPITLAGTPSY